MMDPRRVRQSDAHGRQAGATGPAYADPADEAAWVERIRAGDSGAFELLFRTYYVPLRDFLTTYLGARDAAEEVVQDVFAQVWEQRARWEVRESARRYLFGAARNRAFNVMRHRRIVRRWAVRALGVGSGDGGRHPIADGAEVVGPVPGLGQEGIAADAWLATNELAHAAQRAIAALPERCRQAYTLRLHHDLTRAEIAKVMGISVKAVEFHLMRALKAMRGALAEYT